MKRKFVLGVTAILCMSVCLLTYSLFNITEEDEELYNAYRKQTFRNNFMSATSIIAMVNDVSSQESQTDTSMSPELPGIANTADWIDVLDSVHKAWGSQGGTYTQSTKNMTLWGEPVTVRWDCSGYIGYCLYVNGNANNTTPITSASGSESNSQKNAESFGCMFISPSDIDVYNQLQQGDILFYTGHVEAFYSYNEENINKPYVYNWGSKISSWNKYHDSNDRQLTLDEIRSVQSYGKSGHSLDKLKAIWRLK